MGLLGKIIKRQSAEDAEDLDFDDETVDSLDMPGEESGSRVAILGKVLKWRPKRQSEEAEEGEDVDQDEYPDNAEDSAGPEEDSPVQVVRLEGVPDVHPVGDSNSGLTPGHDQTGPARGLAASPVPGTGQPGPSSGPGAQPAENSSPAEANTPVDLATATEGDTTEGNSNPGGEDLDLSLLEIFGEQEEVDQTLQDLASSVEETSAADLANELQDFLKQLEEMER